MGFTIDQFNRNYQPHGYYFIRDNGVLNSSSVVTETWFRVFFKYNLDEVIELMLDYRGFVVPNELGSPIYFKTIELAEKFIEKLETLVVMRKLTNVD
jgi:hypothetical protein